MGDIDGELAHTRSGHDMYYINAALFIIVVVLLGRWVSRMFVILHEIDAFVCTARSTRNAERE